MPRRRTLLIAATLISLSGASIALLTRRTAQPPPSTLPTTSPTTAPVTPTTAEAPPPLTDYAAFLSRLDPQLDGLAPLPDRVRYDDALALTTPHPVYIDPRGDLWITHPEAPPIAEVLAAALPRAFPPAPPANTRRPPSAPSDPTPSISSVQVHLVREEVLYVHWTRNARGNFFPQPIIRTPTGPTWLTVAPIAATAPQSSNPKSQIPNPKSPPLETPLHITALPLQRPDYLFPSALLTRPSDKLPSQLIVPCTAGVAALTPPTLPTDDPAQVAPTLTESFIPLPTGKTPVTAFLIDGAAVAFRPWDNGDPGSDHAVRLLLEPGAQWTQLTEDDFPSRPIHIFSLTDGSSLAVSLGEDAGVSLEVLLPLRPQPVDEPAVRALVEALSDPRSERRTEAQGQLARFGPSAWPILESLRESVASAEAKQTIDRLLGGRVKPTLGIFTLLPGPVRVACRTPDGALALQAFGGVEYLDLGKPEVASPAVLLARPGRRVLLAHAAVAGEDPFIPVDLQLLRDEVVVNNRLTGPTLLMGNHLVDMLRPEHRGFLTWLGADSAGRRLFRNPATGHSLLLDPAYLDTTPRLPAWRMRIREGDTGWDAANYPAIRRGGTWRLERSAWAPLDDSKNPLLTHDLLNLTAGELGRRTTPRPGDILITPTHLQLPPTSPGEPSTQIPLPQDAQGDPDFQPTLLQIPIPSPARNAPSAPASKSQIPNPKSQITPPPGQPQPHRTPPRLFLLNRPGKIIRLSPDSAGNYKIDAIFRKDIPLSDYRRIWIDPAGRICIAHGPNELTLLFPEGRIPPDLALLVTRPPEE